VDFDHSSTTPIGRIAKFWVIQRDTPVHRDAAASRIQIIAPVEEIRAPGFRKQMATKPEGVAVAPPTARHSKTRAALALTLLILAPLVSFSGWCGRSRVRQVQLPLRSSRYYPAPARKLTQWRQESQRERKGCTCLAVAARLAARLPPLQVFVAICFRNPGRPDFLHRRNESVSATRQRLDVPGCLR